MKADPMVQRRIIYAGKGDHRHIDGAEETYPFTTPERLLADFRLAIERWNHENPDP